jgi:N-methylhydantoinase B/oxoprolinase/acetone carboxylase alpha subunit
MGDGPDRHSLWPGFTNVPNEFLERNFTLRIERHECAPDNGGAGLHRGGDGIHMTYRFLSAGVIAIHDDRYAAHQRHIDIGLHPRGAPTGCQQFQRVCLGDHFGIFCLQIKQVGLVRDGTA